MKIFLLLVLIFANYSAYATDPDIAADATTSSCNSDVLNSDNGSVDIEINWEPNVIPLRWYSGNTLLPVENNDDTCAYDGVLNRPTNPTREGYNFAGWRIRPTMDFSTIPTNNNGIKIWSKGWFLNKNYCTYQDSQNIKCNSDITFTELQTYEWKVSFEHGNLYGMARCSSEGEGLGLYNTSGSTVDNSTGVYCWCKATGYKPNNSDTIYGPSAILSWMFLYKESSGDRCAQVCTYHCTSYIRNYLTARTVLLTPANNQNAD